MSFQTIIIEERCKLKCSNNYLIIEKEEQSEKVYLENVKILLINNLETLITTCLINQLIKFKICVIFGNEVKSPSSQLLPLYGTFDCSQKLQQQILWDKQRKEQLWLKILELKIKNQCNLLEQYNLLDFDINSYFNKLTINDEQNIEGTIAKLYFNRLFGRLFNRRLNNNINAMLNYGYAIVLSFINNEIILNGYTKKLGIHHKNKTNLYNLTSDLMEPIRPFVDRIVYDMRKQELNKNTKLKLINVLYEKCAINNKTTQLYLGIQIYLKSIFDYLECKSDQIKEITYE